MDFKEKFGIVNGEEPGQIIQKVMESLKITEENLVDRLSSYCIEKAESILEDCLNIAPYNDYGKFMESRKDMIKFVKNESSKKENWKLFGVSTLKEQNWVEFVFKNTSVDDGESLKGHVYVDLNGKVKHAFAQYFV